MTELKCDRCGKVCKNKGGLSSHQKACKPVPVASEFVVAAAKEVQADPEYFPGKDYPDREVWLKIRAAQHQKPESRVIYRTKHKPQPLALGINAAKRMADAGGNPKHTRSKIAKHRHDYYRQRHEAETKS